MRCETPDAVAQGVLRDGGGWALRRFREWVPALAVMVQPWALAGQQVGDESFRFDNPRPSFEAGRGPTVCIDEGHFNFHTAEGRYKSFADLLRSDGYVVEPYAEPFTVEALQACGVLVVANPLSAENAEDWSYPHPSAFSRPEMQALMAWVRGGGRFLLFADHAPIAGAARDLAAVFGVLMTDAYVDGGPGPDVFRTTDGGLGDHPILRGRGASSERVDSVMTFTGQALQITEGWEPLIVFGPEAVARISSDQTFREGDPWPGFPVGGWIHGAARKWDEGRVVFLGEAAMCSAQVSGPERRPMGMNAPRANQNPQFCLNVVRWLTAVIAPQKAVPRQARVLRVRGTVPGRCHHQVRASPPPRPFWPRPAIRRLSPRRPPRRQGQGPPDSARRSDLRRTSPSRRRRWTAEDPLPLPILQIAEETSGRTGGGPQ